MYFLHPDPEVYRRVVEVDRRKKEGALRDIYDGREYQKNYTNGFLSNVNNISLSLNTDGVAVFKSSKKGELWPLYFIMNELPPKMRYTYNKKSSIINKLRAEIGQFYFIRANFYGIIRLGQTDATIVEQNILQSFGHSVAIICWIMLDHV